jgi:hypothetical protein
MSSIDDPRIVAPRGFTQLDIKSPFIGLSKIHGTVSANSQPCRASCGLWVLRGVPPNLWHILVRSAGVVTRKFSTTLLQGRAPTYFSTYRLTAIATEAYDGLLNVAFLRLNTWKQGILWQLLFRSHLSKQRP